MEHNQVDDLVKMLDGFADSDAGRMKIQMSEDLQAGAMQRSYHLGRCDINSPWACGTAFDNQEEK